VLECPRAVSVPTPTLQEEHGRSGSAYSSSNVVASTVNSLPVPTRIHEKFAHALPTRPVSVFSVVGV